MKIKEEAAHCFNSCKNLTTETILDVLGMIRVISVTVARPPSNLMIILCTVRKEVVIMLPKLISFLRNVGLILCPQVL